MPNPETEFDSAVQLVNEFITRARRGEGLTLSDLQDRWTGSPAALTGALYLTAIGQPVDDPDHTPHPRDLRRATTFLAGWATGDQAVFEPPMQEAARDGRLHHLLAAVAEHATQALALRTNPHNLAELRRAAAIWTQQEEEK